MASWTKPRRQRERALCVRFLSRTRRTGDKVPGLVGHAYPNRCSCSRQYVIDEQQRIIIASANPRACTDN